MDGKTKTKDDMASCSFSLHLISPLSPKPKSLFWKRWFSRDSTQRLTGQILFTAARLRNHKHCRTMWLRCDQAWPWQITGFCKYCVRLLSQQGSLLTPDPGPPCGKWSQAQRGRTSGSLPQLTAQTFPSLSFLPEDLLARISCWSDWVSALGKGWNIIPLRKMFLLYLQIRR